MPTTRPTALRLTFNRRFKAAFLAEQTLCRLSAAQPRLRSVRVVFRAFMRSRSCFPARKKGTVFAATATGSPLRGLRPRRGSRCLTVKAPKPRRCHRKWSPRGLHVLTAELGIGGCQFGDAI
jgi:hypothetical protein